MSGTQEQEIKWPGIGEGGVEYEERENIGNRKGRKGGEVRMQDD